MTYIQPSVDEEMEIRQEHILEKINLKELEATIDFKVNNPVLTQQRDKVRKLKDRIILIEGYEEYARLNTNTCKFPIDEYCEGKTNYNFFSWIIYGNCCKTCNQKYNRATPHVFDEEPRFVRSTAWDELLELDSIDNGEI